MSCQSRVSLFQCVRTITRNHFFSCSFLSAIGHIALSYVVISFLAAIQVQIELYLTQNNKIQYTGWCDGVSSCPPSQYKESLVLQITTNGVRQVGLPLFQGTFYFLNQLKYWFFFSGLIVPSPPGCARMYRAADENWWTRGRESSTRLPLMAVGALPQRRC